MAKRKKPRSKKGKPQWGYRPPGMDKHCALFTDEDVVNKLAGLCGINDNERREKLRQELEQVAKWGLNLTYIKDTETSNKDQRAALVKLKKQADHMLLLTELIEVADSDTRSGLFESYRRRTPLGKNPDEEINTGELLAEDIQHARSLYNAVDDALASLRPGQGRPGDFPLNHACDLLISIYNNFSDEPFTFDYEPKLKAFFTNGALFVESAVNIIFPEVTQANIATAIRDVQKNRPS